MSERSQHSLQSKYFQVHHGILLPRRVKLIGQAQFFQTEAKITHCLRTHNSHWVVSRIFRTFGSSQDAPREYGPHKTLYNRFVRWSRLGVFDNIFTELAKSAGSGGRVMIDATHLKAHRTAASLVKKGLFPVVSGAQRVG